MSVLVQGLHWFFQNFPLWPGEHNSCVLFYCSSSGLLGPQQSSVVVVMILVMAALAAVMNE